MIIGTTAAANIAVNPMMLYHAAIPLRVNATSNVALLKEKNFLTI
jgi:hypothetical protein